MENSDVKITIKPVDLFIKEEDDKSFFFADEKMHNILVNDDINSYLDYIRNKHESIINPLPQIIEKEIKPVLHIKYKLFNTIVDSIIQNISNLEDTIKRHIK